MAAALATLVGAKPALAAGGEEPRYAPVAVQTNFEGQDPERTKRLQASLEKRAVEVLQHQYDIEVRDPAEAKAEIVIYVRDLEEGPTKKLAVLDYGVRVEVQIDGENVGDQIVPCMEKGEAELVDCAIGGIPAVLEHLPTEEVPTEAPKDPPVQEGNPDGPEDQPTDRVAPIGGLGVVGIVVGAGGIATLIAGGVYLGRGEVTDDVGGFDDAQDFRPRGRVLVGVGAGLLGVGMIALGVDVGLRAKKRKKTAARLRLNTGPGIAGIGLSGRF